MARHSITRMAATSTSPRRGAPAPPPVPAERSGVELSTGASTLGEMILRGRDRDGVALRYKESGRWNEVSYARFVSSARSIARGLMALGLEPGDRVSILADTRPDWTLADAGSFCAGAVVAPIYQTSSPEECEYVLRHSEARAVFCEDAGQVAKVEQVRERCPALEHVIAFQESGPGSISMERLIDLGAEVPARQVEERVAAISPDSVATLVYTSGTTGPPKACMLTHLNWIAEARGLEQRLNLDRTDAPIEFFLFLPLAHVMARITQIFTLDVGGTLIYWQRDPEHLLDEIREARPTYFPSVPRVWEKIYTAATTGIADQPWFKRALFKWSLEVGHRMRELERSGATPSRALAVKHRLADRLVYSKVRDLFGGRLELAVSSAAPIPLQVLEFFDACGILLVEMWGMTEMCGAGTLNTDVEMKLGTVGKPMPGLEMRVADDGELLARGPIVFAGYFKNEQATQETLPGGWLATGDLGAIDTDGFVTITGRKKDLIITSSGKNITPANIENALKEIRWISEAVVFGDNRPYLVALLTLDPEEAPKLAAKLGIAPDVPTMAGDTQVVAEVENAVDVVNQRFARIEQIKHFAILDRQLTQSDGELTPTLKIKRNIIYEEFAGLFDSLYATRR